MRLYHSFVSLWCGRQDSNLHAFAEEPKGDVTSVKVLQLCALIKNFNILAKCVHLIPASLGVAVHQDSHLAECIDDIACCRIGNS